MAAPCPTHHIAAEAHPVGWFRHVMAVRRCGGWETRNFVSCFHAKETLKKDYNDKLFTKRLGGILGQVI